MMDTVIHLGDVLEILLLLVILVAVLKKRRRRFQLPKPIDRERWPYPPEHLKQAINNYFELTTVWQRAINAAVQEADRRGDLQVLNLLPRHPSLMEASKSDVMSFLFAFGFDVKDSICIRDGEHPGVYLHLDISWPAKTCESSLGPAQKVSALDPLPVEFFHVYALIKEAKAQDRTRIINLLAQHPELACCNVQDIVDAVQTFGFRVIVVDETTRPPHIDIDWTNLL